jgi:hypothetical protein
VFGARLTFALASVVMRFTPRRSIFRPVTRELPVALRVPNPPVTCEVEVSVVALMFRSVARGSSAIPTPRSSIVVVPVVVAELRSPFASEEALESMTPVPRWSRVASPKRKLPLLTLTDATCAVSP